MIFPKRLSVVGAAALLLAACGGSSSNSAKSPRGGSCSDTTVAKSSLAATAEYRDAGVAPSRTPDTWNGLVSMRDEEVNEWNQASTTQFGTPRHVKLTKVAARCSETLGAAQWRQDTLLQFDASAHFDNCAFQPTLAYIDSLLAEVDCILSKGRSATEVDVASAMGRLGRVLHAVQDFYSHSNYVEMRDAQNLPFDELLVLPVWTKGGQDEVLRLVAAGLVSGRVWWDSPKQCAASVKTHGEMAKDDEGMPAGKAVLPYWHQTGYRAAYQLAGFATVHFLKYSYERWPVLAETCGPIVQTALPVADHRPEAK